MKPLDHVLSQRIAELFDEWVQRRNYSPKKFLFKAFTLSKEPGLYEVFMALAFCMVRERRDFSSKYVQRLLQTIKVLLESFDDCGGMGMSIAVLYHFIDNAPLSLLTFFPAFFGCHPYFGYLAEKDDSFDSKHFIDVSSASGLDEMTKRFALRWIMEGICRKAVDIAEAEDRRERRKKRKKSKNNKKNS